MKYILYKLFAGDVTPIPILYRVMKEPKGDIYRGITLIDYEGKDRIVIRKVITNTGKIIPESNKSVHWEFMLHRGYGSELKCRKLAFRFEDIDDMSQQRLEFESDRAALLWFKLTY